MISFSYPPALVVFMLHLYGAQNIKRMLLRVKFITSARMCTLKGYYGPLCIDKILYARASVRLLQMHASG